MAETQTETGLEKYLDPKVLARIHRLDIRTRLVVEGFISGLHRSPFRGLSVEFAQHREYVPGDDIKHIDWKVYSRSDRFFIKQYEEETNLRATFLVDSSESMRYAGAAGGKPRLTKFHYAACLAASLAHLLQRQQDAVGLITFDEDVRHVLPPSTRPEQLKRFVHVLDQASGELKAKTSLEEVCHKVAAHLASRGLVCLISDLFVDDDDALLRGLHHLLHDGHDILVLHIFDEDELTFPFDGNIQFKGLEQMGQLVAQPQALREGYLESLREFIGRVRSGCASSRISYRTVNTAEHLGAVLAEFLAAREMVAHKSASKRR